MTNNLDTLATALYVRTESALAAAGINLLRPARKASPTRPAPRSSGRCARSSKRSTTPSKGQLDLERHGGHTPEGVTTRILQRILVLTTAIWHNDMTRRPVIP